MMRLINFPITEQTKSVDLFLHLLPCGIPTFLSATNAKGARLRKNFKAFEEWEILTCFGLFFATIQVRERFSSTCFILTSATTLLLLCVSPFVVFFYNSTTAARASLFGSRSLLACVARQTSAVLASARNGLTTSSAW